MYVILSQKIDTESSYSDELFKTYHYPAIYRNRINIGDIFVYYQGNRYEKAQRYYFGTGTIGKIHTIDNESYYAELIKCRRFETTVPIYLPDGGYIEQRGYQDVRKSINPPWQSSIRPLSQAAFEFIISKADGLTVVNESANVEALKVALKKAVKDFYLGGRNAAINDVIKTARDISASLNVDTYYLNESDVKNNINSTPTSYEHGEERSHLLDYCKSMKMSYSYKPVLILSLLETGDEDGSIDIERAAAYFKEFYKRRLMAGLKIEKGNCIYQDSSVDLNSIAGNIIANPVKALVLSRYFFFDPNAMKFGIVAELWKWLSEQDKMMLKAICLSRLNNYYSSK